MAWLLTGTNTRAREIDKMSSAVQDYRSALKRIQRKVSAEEGEIIEAVLAKHERCLDLSMQENKGKYSSS
jgi:outer membrane murein-binding lipoprotein Lpp